MRTDTLQDLPFVNRFCFHPVLESTNDAAREITDLPESGMIVVQADRQTAGRGRSGTPFYSSTDDGLWVSIIVPVQSICDHFSFNRALSIAICEAVENMSSIKTACSIKWPNDIYWAGRKLCGILLENHPARANTLVIGFGLNVTTPSFPEELRNIATSLFIETGKRFSRSELLRNILTDFRRNLDLPVAKAHQLYDRRLFGTGHGAEVDGHRGVYEGVGIDGTLRLRTTRDVIHVITGHLRFTDTPGENHAR